MPNIKKDLEKLKHPNSRKTLSLAKKLKKAEKRDQHKLGTHIKQNLLGEKIIWFKERIPENCLVLTKQQTLELIENYLARFDEELDQITLKNSIGQRKHRQYASREDIIAMTKGKELEEFNSCGLEIPDLMDQKQMEVLQTWNGELRYLQHFKLRRISRKHLTS